MSPQQDRLQRILSQMQKLRGERAPAAVVREKEQLLASAHMDMLLEQDQQHRNELLREH